MFRVGDRVNNGPWASQDNMDWTWGGTLPYVVGTVVKEITGPLTYYEVEWDNCPVGLSSLWYTHELELEGATVWEDILCSMS